MCKVLVSGSRSFECPAELSKSRQECVEKMPILRFSDQILGACLIQIRTRA